MKYDESTPLGQDWAGCRRDDAYDWNPATLVPGVPAKAVAGRRGAAVDRDARRPRQLEYMAFPRLPGIAELGWSQASSHDWDTYKVRLGAQGSRWDVLSVNFYRAPEIDWH